MSQISARSRGSSKKASNGPKLRKKVAPKVVSSRPKKSQPSSQGHKNLDTGPIAAAEIETSTTDSFNLNVSSPSLTTSETISLQALTDRMPLPTLPSEQASNGLHTPLEPPDADMNVQDLFTDEATVKQVATPTTLEQEAGTRGELSNLHNHNSTPDITVTDKTSAVDKEASVLTTRAAALDSVVVGSGNPTVQEVEDSTGETVTVGEVTAGGHESTIVERSEVTTTAASGDGMNEATVKPKKSTRKRSQLEMTIKESGDSLPHPRPKRSRRQPVLKERKAPDRTTMTMQELIYYNPTANPMQAALQERVRRRGSTAPPSPEEEEPPPEETTNLSMRTSPASSERGGSEDRLVPQLRIGADGNIIIDEASMVMDTTPTENPYADSEAIVETSGYVNSESFRKSYKITRWTKDETNKFFKALSHVGTDFTMMTLLVPNRSRKELKNKFKREEKKSPHLVAQALKNQIKVQKVSS